MKPQIIEDFNAELLLSEIQEILYRGNSAEVKFEKDNIVVVEIKRKAKIKMTCR